MPEDERETYKRFLPENRMRYEAYLMSDYHEAIKRNEALGKVGSVYFSSRTFRNLRQAEAFVRSQENPEDWAVSDNNLGWTYELINNKLELAAT
jgi:hypothetical protein